MAKLINASINLSKIDKSKFIVGKSGDQFLNVTISVNDEKDQYENDASIFISQSKEERANKTSKVYLGNGKTFWTNETPQIVKPVPVNVAPINNVEETLPF